MKPPPADPTKPRRAVFLDRDGVVNRALLQENKPYPPRSVAEVDLLPGVPEACRRLKEAGYLLVIATNQPDVGRGTLPLEAVEAIHAFLRQRLPIDRIEVCYDPGGGDPPNPRRKPRPGMLLQAARELNIDLSRSYMVGDRWRDIDCGAAAGCRTILVDYNYDETLPTPPDYRVRTLAQAADLILSRTPCPG